MNSDPQKSHIRFIVTCVTILGTFCIILGAYLTWRGFNAELLIGGGTSAIAGLLGVLSTQRGNPPAQDVTISGNPPKVEMTQPESEQPKP